MLVSDPASPNVTVPGPLTSLHATVTVPGGSGSPSSLTDPASVSVFGKLTLASTPAFATGAWFAADTVTTTSSVPLSAPSFAVSRNV